MTLCMIGFAALQLSAPGSRRVINGALFGGFTVRDITATQTAGAASHDAAGSEPLARMLDGGAFVVMYRPVPTSPIAKHAANNSANNSVNLTQPEPESGWQTPRSTLAHEDTH